MKIYLIGQPAKPIMTRMNVKAIEAKLDPNWFCWWHQSYKVPLSWIISFQKTRIVLGRLEILVGGRYAEAFLLKYRGEKKSR
ncbi:hypothetical protein GVN20_21835 [Runella sp. CRIBMP]|nr:hypothetical protein [Runella sp. CRIBMP]